MSPFGPVDVLIFLAAAAFVVAGFWPALICVAIGHGSIDHPTQYAVGDLGWVIGYRPTFGRCDRCGGRAR